MQIRGDCQARESNLDATFIRSVELEHAFLEEVPVRESQPESQAGGTAHLNMSFAMARMVDVLPVPGGP